MILSHNGHSPTIHSSAFIAPNATVCGQVTVGRDCRVMHGAQIIAEGGTLTIGDQCIILENAVVRSTSRHNTTIGRYCLIGPNAHVAGCTIEDEVFVATGASVFHSARLGKGSEVRVHGIVHLLTHLPAGEIVPIGWVAVGKPARILPPTEHEDIWQLQEPLNFPLVVYGFDRSEADMRKITARLAESLKSHERDSAP